MQNDDRSERKVIALERYFYRRPNPNVVMVGRFWGDISKERMLEAIKMAKEMHPMICAKVRLAEDGEAYYSWDCTGEPVLEFLEGDFQENDILKVARKELKTLQALDHGPLLRFVLFRSPGRFDLLINSHHMISDGLSLYYLLIDIFGILTQPEKVGPARAPVAVGDNLPAEAGLRGYHQRLIASLNKSWQKKDIRFGQDALERLHNKFWETETGLNIIHWNMSKEDTSKLVNKCKVNGATVHSALCTAFLIAQKEVQGEDKYLRNISMPVSIRNRLRVPVERDFGLYYSSFKLSFKFPKDKDFWLATEKVHSHIQNNIADFNVFTIYMQLMALHPTLVDSISFTRYGLLDDKLAKRFLKLEGDYTNHTGLDLSNLGAHKLPPGKNGIEFTGILGPAIYNEFQEKYVGVITLDGEMCFTLTHCDCRVSKEKVNALRDRTMSILAGAIQ